MANTKMDRRALISGVGAATAGVVIGRTNLSAQTPATTFQPARHPQDEWFDKIPGKHRVILDTVSPDGAGQGIGYSNNVFNASQQGYGLTDADLALVLCLRHHATAFAFNNAMWAKYGKVFAERMEWKDYDPAKPPTSNPRNSGERPALDRLARRGAHFAVCGLATRMYASLIAGEGGDSAAAYKELEANTIANAHIMAAGVVAIQRAQEYGYSVIHVG